jgi:nucleotide-binding universal stress UspA family protein
LPEETASNPDTQKLSEPVRRNIVHIFEPRLAPLKAEFVIESGETVETILKVARDKSADMIVLGVRDAFLPGVHVRTSVASNHGSISLPGCQLPVDFAIVRSGSMGR